MSLSKVIHISVLFIYLFTSCFVVGVNRWLTKNDYENKSFAEKLFSKLIVPISDQADDTNDIPILFKDPSDDGSIIVDYFPTIITFAFITNSTSFYGQEKIKDPFLNIFSPPPQFS